MEEHLKSDLKNCNYVSITHDGWTSCNTESYSCVTAHFITVAWKLVSAVLQTKKVHGSHTGENIADALKEVKQQWSLSEIVAVTDNAANEKKAFEILQWLRFGCYGHRINLVVKNALNESREIVNVFAKGRKLVTFFHQSSSASDMLKVKQNLILSEQQVGHKLIMDVPTRWNSTLAMLRRLLEQAPAIMALASDSGDTISKTAKTTIKNCAFSFEELSLIEKLVEVLTPFEIATSILCGDHSPTMHKVLPILIKIEKCVTVSDDDATCIKKIKEKMSEEMRKRCDVDNDEEISLLACILNPMMKNLDFLNETQKDYALRLLTEKALVAQLQIKIKTEKCDDTPTHPPLPELPSVTDLEMQLGQESVAEEIADTPQHIHMESTKSANDPENEISLDKKPKLIVNVDIDDWLSDVVYVGSSTKSSSETIIQKEIGRYISLEIPDAERALSILEWWNQNQYIFPRLSLLAKNILVYQRHLCQVKGFFPLLAKLSTKKDPGCTHQMWTCSYF